MPQIVFFLYDKSSSAVPEFVTEWKENIDLYDEISNFGKKVNAKYGINL